MYSKEQNKLITYILQNIRKALQPGNEKCTIMFLINLAEPKWISVECDKKIIGSVACVNKHQVGDHLATHYPTKICEKSAILFESQCYSIFWYDRKSLSIKEIKQMCSKKHKFVTKKSKLYFLKTVFLNTKLNIFILASHDETENNIE